MTHRSVSPLLKLTVVAAAVGALLWPGPAEAVKYLTLSEAIHTFVPKDAKIFKVSKKLTAEQTSRLATDYGWKASDDEYVFYEGKDAAGTTLATVFIVPEAFNTCFHKYAVGINAKGEVIDTVVVELSCPRSFKVNRKSFLAQFEGKKHDAPLTIKLDIDGVTEATLSSEAVAIATRKAVSLHNLLADRQAGSAEPAKVSDKVRTARAAGAAMIQKAIATGETLAKDGGVGGAQLPPEGK